MAVAQSRQEPFLPDLCQVPAVFFLVLVGELLAVVLVLVQPGLREFSWTHLSLVSFYVQWIVLLNGGLLCWCRRYLMGLTTAQVALASFILILSATTGLSVATRMLLMPSTSALVFDPLDSVGDVLITAIMAGIALRYFYLQHELRLQQQAELQARLDALQARIRPHFLFNSMNAIASMIAVDPMTAEAMIVDLAGLFRGALAKDRVATLAEEIEFAHSYLHIEQMRLGNRLSAHWQVEPGLETAKVPVLFLQPLLENAVYHGIQPLPEGGIIQISIRNKKGNCCIEIANPVRDSAAGSVSVGHGMALENTRRRLEALYPGKASLEAISSGSNFTVRIEIPLALAG